MITFLNIKIRLLPFLAVLLLTSCESPDIKTNRMSYFDLKSYFEKQQEILQIKKIGLKKFITKDSLTEEKYIQIVNWQEELKPFEECDINKPSWKNSYKIDSLIDGGMLFIKYIAIDSILKIKKITLVFERDSLTSLTIEKNTGSPYFDYTTTLNYFPLKAFSITTSQKIIFTKKTILGIKAIFVN